jgi:hypothetical protein
VQTPVPRHTVQACPSRQVPVLSHVCDMLPLQRIDPGTQVPVQVPPEQRYMHAGAPLVQ